MTNTCRTCQYWKPYLTGEQWGVRSFIDAPKEEQERVMALITDEDDEYADTYDYVDKFEECGVTVGRPPHQMSLKKWPEWGECGLTSLRDHSKSLAYAIDGSNYMAELRCHYSFGCVQYEALRLPNENEVNISDEITPEMEQSGAHEIERFDNRFESPEDAAVRVFRAMINASRNSVLIDGAKGCDIDITQEMIEAGLVELHAYNPEISDGTETVREIISTALAAHSSKVTQ